MGFSTILNSVSQLNRALEIFNSNSKLRDQLFYILGRLLIFFCLKILRTVLLHKCQLLPLSIIFKSMQ